ncbi:hypothetical protein EVAR_14884_1 [Eumeta japonica]|uniref:Uncharacterized protein n=1 Tax=Eumeta variegata TaxID=151549 RepID=A0A4C1V306_EUMVA|nr:hypothetical protein EVAR_14884_1 [Eumeta japonica]
MRRAREGVRRCTHGGLSWCPRPAGEGMACVRLGVLWALLATALADSWTAYQEQPCCRPANHHRVRHHRVGTAEDPGRDFREGYWRVQRTLVGTTEHASGDYEYANGDCRRRG